MIRLCVALIAVAAAAETHKVSPEHHSRVFPPGKKPVDTVVTRTWDSGGQDYKSVRHIQHPYVYPEGGNPLMGPFYIKGAEYSDALEVTPYRLSPAVLNAGENLYPNVYKMDAPRPKHADLIPWDHEWWPTPTYGFTPSDAHLLPGTVAQHEVVTYFGTMATLIARKYLPKQ